MNIENSSEQSANRLGWRKYVALGAGVVALGGVWALSDPESALAFGERIVDVVTPDFRPLFENPLLG